MQTKERRQALLLVALLAVLMVVVWWQFGGGFTPAATPAGASGPGRAASRAAGRGPAAVESGPVVVHLDWLDRAFPEPAVERRDPFVFGAAREAPVPPPSEFRPPGVIAAAEGIEGPPEPPPPPPIPYRFIGLLDAPGAGRIAVLSDGRFVYHGREGDIIDGRYRLVSVTSSSVQLEYLDGRGRQTLQLSGS